MRAIFTIGHSTRSLDELIGLLDAHGVLTVADVRTVPRSRKNPQFNRDALSAALPTAGICYRHFPYLGGLRHSRLGDTSPNKGWENESFRAYADYIQTPEFHAGLDELLQAASEGPLALMCAEAVPWRCQRSLIADALLVRGITVRHIMGLNRVDPHRLTRIAQVDGVRIAYAGPADPSRGADSKEAGAAQPNGCVE
jgi:uncharacterized protein (DUF488 family)